VNTDQAIADAIEIGGGGRHGDRFGDNKQYVIGK
jgi:hypothetical protein